MDKSYRTEHQQYKDDLVKKLIEVLQIEIEDYGGPYKEFESYLYELFEREDNLYQGLIYAVEHYLNK